MANKSRNWCFTLNNYSDQDIEAILGWDVKYVVYGKECGEEGTPHLQGFVIMKNENRMVSMKKLHATAHWEICKGSWEQNYEYCVKEADFTEHGEKPTSKRERADNEKARWTIAKNAAKEGRMDDIPDDIWCRFYRTWKEIKKDHMQKPDDADDVCGLWIYGPPGTGKSRQARKDYPGAYLKGQNKWWDGYQDQDYVILDDFDTGSLGHHLKIWGDRYSFLAEVKGGTMHIRPKKIIITSNYSPEDPKFEWDSEMTAAVRRRFKCIQMVELYRL